jgi:hypothetical protein
VNVLKPELAPDTRAPQPRQIRLLMRCQISLRAEEAQ